jgi:hypothetical protein
MALFVESTVTQFAKAVDDDGAGERALGFAFVEDAAGTPPLGIVEPVEHNNPRAA